MPSALLGVAALGIGSAIASGRHGSGPFARGYHRGLAVGRAQKATRGASSRVIVVLRNQLSWLPATSKHVRARMSAEVSANGAFERDVQRAGGRIYRRFHALNAFAATVSPSLRAHLAKSPGVAAVVPDALVTLPTLGSQSAKSGAAHTAAANEQLLCPADPSKPLLEPEALQATHTAYMDPSTPQAQSLANGAGVKVAFFADGLNINNPDFIRPDGSHVFIDYKDFSGDGPNAPSNSLEAFGDAGSVAAQGRRVYDISQFVNPAHPLPKGCNITVRGVAPGASLIGIKVFANSNSSFNSVILQGLDYALTNDHPDVINESFGGYPVPDSTQDLTRLFNEQAVADGVTVVESTGDSGVESSPSSASSDPSVIAAGASTTFRNYAQGTQYGYQFAHGWISNNISSIESGGFTQGGRVLDLVAPGEANWALCSDNTPLYQGCTNYAGKPTNLQSFGGTSESSPLIAGGAALVIQAYRATHGGATPSPQLVRALLTSTATDLHVPSAEQGAGEMNTLAAVQAAQSMGRPTQATGDGLLVQPTQLDLSGQAGTPFSKAVQVTNLGSSAQTVSAHVRQIATQLSNQTGSVNLNDERSPKFVDQFGHSVPYEKITFQVPAGADRLVAFLAWSGPSARVGLTLIDPTGKLAAYTRPQGNGNHGEVDVATPVSGTWTGLIFRRSGTFNGTVQWQALSQQVGGVDQVTPSSATLAPGQTTTFDVSSSFPGSAGDFSQDLVLSSGGGSSSIVPIVLRSLVPITGTGGRFDGDLIGGNGRNGAGQPGQIDTYDFQVPSGRPELTVSLAFDHSPGSEIVGSVINPQGQTVAAADNAYIAGSGAKVFTTGLETYTVSPEAGTWRFVVDIINPVGGHTLSSPYHGRIGFAAPPTHVGDLPQSSSTHLRAGRPSKLTVRLTNNGIGTLQAFLDPRLREQSDFALLSLTPDANLPLPIPAGVSPPLYLIPTETNAVGALAAATEPVFFDFGFLSGDPDLPAVSSGNTASGFFSGFATPGTWDIAPDPVGPFSGPAPPGKVSTAMVVQTRGFDQNTASSTGDLENQTVNPNAPFTPLMLSPGQSGTMTLTITPSGKPGQHVRGILFVDVFDPGTAVSGEVASFPYEYTVG